jgi:hypothetical protein
MLLKGFWAESQARKNSLPVFLLFLQIFLCHEILVRYRYHEYSAAAAALNRHYGHRIEKLYAYVAELGHHVYLGDAAARAAYDLCNHLSRLTGRLISLF